MQAAEFKVAFLGNFANRISGNPHKKFARSKIIELKFFKENFINPRTTEAVEFKVACLGNFALGTCRNPH